MVQSYVPKFSYIIPFRYRQDRILPLRRVIEWLSGFQGVEIILVEQDRHSKIDYLNLKVNHIFVKSEAPFNKSWAYNIGVKRALSKVIVFGDADFIMNPLELIEGLKTLEHFDCVIPTNKVVMLTQQQSAMDSNNILKLQSTQSKKNKLDGLSIFKKTSIEKIGGWNEDMLGIGYENEFNQLKIEKMLSCKQLEYSGFHIFHFPDDTPNNLLDRNKKIYEYYKSEPFMIEQHINQTSPKIGTLNRFSGVTF